jgi:single-stranded DNA-specific DHH superfamily exonuclease
MIPKNQLDEIRGWLEKAQNPVFFFDNDCDGLISFLLLRRFIKRGKGVSIKSFPSLNESYTRKIRELKPDVIFILDKPLVDKEFFEETKLQNIPVIWIDHHPFESEITENVHYYNPRLNKPESSEPVSYWCYKLTKQDLWLAMIGSVADWHIPDFFDEFKKEYPDLIDDKKTASEILYKTRIGKLIQLFNFALKDRTTNVIKMIKLLVETKSPYDLLSEDKKYSTMFKRYSQLNKKFERLFEKANEIARKSGKVILFRYSGQMKLSSELANKLYYVYSGKIVIVAYIQGEKASLSLRGYNVRKYMEKAFEKVQGTGGGHEQACAASVKVDDLKNFVDEIKKWA